ncbi:hypothetical protein C6I20_13900 [Aeromicrobium sp. A1-2]|uniref:DUF3592 domain-containing protein n=1 Tax=Aeromicrobium sp. A1-2 TaxID=2107713 RepID=UPI000E4D55E9|nr:DUF3592 domain-containing protein [Aeromicrobium sp. A1-2]AXT86163.1 hypothetical protein C6I20_13900 [Aeromicrobium sp. A1-2]
MSLSFVPVVLLVGGVVLLAWAVRRRQALKLLPHDWVRVTGTVLDVGGSRRVEYAGQGGRRLRLQVPPGVEVPDGEVDVLLDPHDSSRARLASVDRAAADLVRTLFVTGAVALVLGALAAVAFV